MGNCVSPSSEKTGTGLFRQAETVEYCLYCVGLLPVSYIIQYFYKVLRFSLHGKIAMHSRISGDEDLLRVLSGSLIMGLGGQFSIFS